MKNAEFPTSSKRDENSLYTLTKKFVKLMWESPDLSVGITAAANMLNVAKRRVYDITNVLESVGLITKWNINSVKWIGGNAESIYDETRNKEVLFNLTSEIDAIAEDMTETPLMKLDKEIEELNKKLQMISAEKENLENAFVSYEDIKNLKIFKDAVLFAVKAPDETSVEYPKYVKGGYRMKVSTESGEISVFYIENEKQNN